ASPRDQEIKPQALRTEDGEIKVNTRRSQEGKITDVETRSEPKDPAIAADEWEVLAEKLEAGENYASKN
ncbi:unnamed protein product, partial [Ascophyllum nodosum]